MEAPQVEVRGLVVFNEVDSQRPNFDSIQLPHPDAVFRISMFVLAV